MVTKDGVQRAIDVLKTQNLVHPIKPENHRVGESGFRIPNMVEWWQIQPLLGQNRGLEEAFALIGAASNSKNMRHAFEHVFPNWDLGRRMEFYKNLPSDVLETDPPLGVYPLVRNWAEQIASMFQSLMKNTHRVPPPVFRAVLGELLDVYDNPPKVVSRGEGVGGDIHRLFFGAVVYPALSDETTRKRVWTGVVDAAHNVVAYHQNDSRRLDSANTLHYVRVAYPTEFLPILHALDGVSDYPLSHTNITERYFWDMTGRKIHFSTIEEAMWAGQLFAELFGTKMEGLFKSRNWDAESVRKVLRDGLEQMTDPTMYKPKLKEIFKKGYQDTLTALIESFGRTCPQRAARFLWAAANTVASPKDALMFATAVAHNEQPQVVRDIAHAYLAHAYLRGCSWVGHDPKRGVASQDAMKKRGEVAKTLCSSLLGIRHPESRRYTPQMWTTLWDGYAQLILHPERLMGSSEESNSFRRALEKEFIDRLCGK